MSAQMRTDLIQELIFTSNDFAERYEQAVDAAHESGQISDVERLELLRSSLQWIEQTREVVGRYEGLTKYNIS